MERLKYIDSLRGIAALIVVLFHLIDVFFSDFQFGKSEAEIEHLKIFARTIFNGSDWVSFFFVLSGFSLSLFYLKMEQEIDLKKFYLKRFFRIYPLYICVLLISFGIHFSKTTWTTFVSQFLLFNYNNELIPPSWSLSIEWIGSLLFPFFIVLFKHNKLKFYYLTAISLLLYNGIGNAQTSFSGFILNFLLGIILADLYLRNRLVPLKKYLFIVFPFIIISFTARWAIDFFPIFKNQILFFTEILHMDFHQFFYFLSAFGSFFLIYTLLQNSRIQQILSNKICVFLGKISFSIYILHYLLIHLLFSTLVHYFSFVNNEILHGGISVLSLILVIVLCSTLTHYLIEKPFINWVKLDKNQLKK
jgi:peptidoglycan/LPS O-acetylase OafA/YrhL